MEASWLLGIASCFSKRFQTITLKKCGFLRSLEKIPKKVLPNTAQGAADGTAGTEGAEGAEGALERPSSQVLATSEAKCGAILSIAAG